MVVSHSDDQEKTAFAKCTVSTKQEKAEQSPGLWNFKKTRARSKSVMVAAQDSWAGPHLFREI